MRRTLAIFAVLVAVLLGLLFVRRSLGPAHPGPPSRLAAAPRSVGPSGGRLPYDRQSSPASDAGAGGLATISGRVVDPSGALAQAQVVVEQLSDEVLEGPPIVVGAPAGTFTMTVPACHLRLGASSATLGPSPPVELQLTAGESLTGVELTLSADPVTVTGLVEDSLGGVIAHAQVHARGPHDWAAVTASDDQGRFALRVRRGPAVLTGRADGYAEATLYLTTATDGEVRLRLAPEGQLKGRVVDHDEGVAGAEISVAGTNGESHHGFSGADGRFVVAGLAPGSCSVDAWATNRRALRVVVQITPGTTAEALLVLRRAEVLDVIVRAHGQPLANALVTTNRRHARTNSAGRARLEPLGRGQTTVAIDAGERHHLTSVQLPAAQPLEIDLPDAATVLVEVTDVLGPAAGVEVQLKDAVFSAPRAALTGPDGRARFADISPGTVRASVRDPGPGRAPIEGEPITVKPGAEALLRLLLLRGARLEGVARFDRGGGPAPGALVSMTASHLHAQTRTDAQGRFVIEAAPPGSIRLAAARHLDQAWMMEGDLRFEVADGEVKRGIELTVTRSSGALGGVVVDRGGHPVGGAEVTLQASSIDPDGPTTFTGLDGRFLFDEVDDREWTLAAKEPTHGGAHAEHLRPGAAPLRLVLPGAARLAGRAVDARGAPVSAGWLMLSPADESDLEIREQALADANGSFAFEGLVAGRYLVSVDTDEGASGVTPPLTVGPAEVRKGVVVVVRPSGRLVAKLVMDGQPAGGLVGSAGNAQGTSDPSGRLVVEPLPVGAELALWVFGGQRPLNRTFTIPSDARELDLGLLELKPPAKP